MTHPLAPGVPAPQEPVRCVHCTGHVVNTETGWTHIDQYGQLAGWLCPLPHMTLATFPDPFTAGHVPAAPEPEDEPSWVAAVKVPMARHSRPPDPPVMPL